MVIAFDAKRAFHNRRGLGNYSRDVLRLVSAYAPENKYLLCTPRQPKYADGQLAVSSGVYDVLYPRGFWSISPSAWRTWGCTDDVVNAGAEAYWGLSAELPLNIHRTNLRTIVTVHDAIFLRYPELYSHSYRLWLTRKVRYACSVADKIVAVSRQTADDCIDLLGADGKKVSVLYQGCNNIFRKQYSAQELSEFRTRYDLPESYFLYVGAIEPRKNIAMLLDAAEELRSDIPLLIAGGESRYAGQMEKLSREKHLNVLFRHDIPFADFPKLYQCARVFVYVSLFEGFGIPILEALCSGVPVVTSTGSCFSETGGDAALYANPNDYRDIADKMRQASQDNTLRQEMITAGLQHARMFNDENVGRNIKNLIKEIENIGK